MVETSFKTDALNASETGKSREGVLKKLLETQDAYVIELEAKCKFLSSQLIGRDSQASLSAEGFVSIDIEQFEQTVMSLPDRVQFIIKTLNPYTDHLVIRNALDAL
jgi:hypothetical protein